jgi:hypothetical protein
MDRMGRIKALSLGIMYHMYAFYSRRWVSLEYTKLRSIHCHKSKVNVTFNQIRIYGLGMHYISIPFLSFPSFPVYQIIAPMPSAHES